MGMLDRFIGGSNDPVNLLGLPSTMHMPADVRRERDRECGKSIARAQLMALNMRGVEYAALTGAAVISNISQVVENRAAVMPYERGRLDSLADTTAVLMNRMLTDLGGI